MDLARGTRGGAVTILLATTLLFLGPARSEQFGDFRHGMSLEHAMSLQQVGMENRQLQQVEGVSSFPTSAEGHCGLATGGWCGSYYNQSPLPYLPHKRGDKDCPNDCSGVGVCHHDSGMCFCPAGFGGDDCSQPRKRPCWRMGEDKRDLGWHKYTEWTHSRCAGVCDDDIAMCYCPPETKYGHIVAPAGSPLGTPPVKRGRPLYWCHPSSDKDGVPVKWGAVSYEDLFGPLGWCNADQSKFQCPCRIDGVIGSYCNIVIEMYCVNQCSGHGVCDQGFCKCNPGYYGHDCARRRASLPLELGDQDLGKPWLQPAISPVMAAKHPEGGSTRKRPFIYVYDLKPEYNTDILQYRIERGHCSYRSFQMGNRTDWIGHNVYGVETALHEIMLASEHRTFDPEEADYFYVPTHSGCLFDVYGWNPIPMWPKGMHGTRPMGAANMIRETVRWINQTAPWFKRRGGRDHIWLMPHDEGACYAPKEIWPGVILGHWGRMDLNHTSATQYGADNYSADFFHQDFPEGFLAYSSRAHPCFDPKKDLVIPSFKPPPHFRESRYLGVPQKERDILLFFRGDVGRNRNDLTCQYSRCIRQTLYNLSKSQQWKEKYNAIYGDTTDVHGPYGELLMRSKFCLALPGDGWSARFEDGILHGCIPVIVMDNTQVVFESLLDITKFALRVAQADMPKLIDTVAAISPERIKEMQANVDKVWMRYRWKGVIMTDVVEREILEERKMNNGGRLPSNEGVQFAGRNEDSAFSTIVQWLHARMPAVHGGA